jgi:hypothetical protein
MAIQDYVRSIAVDDNVSKRQIFRNLEIQFSKADQDHDGVLDSEQLASFVYAIAWPETDQR